MPPDTSHQNCFDVFRLVFAGMVLWAHVWLIGGFGSDWFARSSRDQVYLAEVGVLGFFAISGFLVADSYTRSSSAWSFLRRRVLRIFPGFYANLLVSALVIGPLIWMVSTGGLSSYPWFGPQGGFHYIFVNAGLVIKAWSVGLPPNPDALDGALWSLALEFACYLALLFVGLCGALNRQRIYLLIITAGLGIYYVMRTSVEGISYPLLPTYVVLGPMHYVVAFLVGACCRAFRESLKFDMKIALLLGVILLGLAKFGGWRIGAPFILPLFILHVAHGFSMRLRHDLSYGIYIYHWPVAKLLVLWPLVSKSLPVFLATNVMVTLVLATGSWWFVERHFLPRHQAPAADAVVGG